MDPKIEVDHRLNISNDIGSSSKTKGKDKARKELWDSLLAVYENEVDNENVMEMEEVEVTDLEEWTVTNPVSCLRAQTQLAVTNPQILSAAAFSVADNADLIGELDIEDIENREKANKKHTSKMNEQERFSSTHKSCRCKSLSFTKTKKNFSPARKCKKPRLIAQEQKLSASKIRKKVKEKETRHLKAIKENTAGEVKDKNIEIKKKITKHKLVALEKAKENIQDSKVSINGKEEKLSVSLMRRKIQTKKYSKKVKDNRSKQEEECKGIRKEKINSEKSKERVQNTTVETKCKMIKLKADAGKSPNHKCKLQYRYYSNAKNVSARPDNRFFNCKLIFKVCHCSESNIVL